MTRRAVSIVLATLIMVGVALTSAQDQQQDAQDEQQQEQQSQQQEAQQDEEARDAEAAGSLRLRQPGNFVVDAEGRSVYIYLQDGTGRSTCQDQCAQNWPPVTMEAEPTVGPNLMPHLIGTIERQDGAMQLTYNGWPLYHYEHDQESGDIYGHGLGDMFYLVGASGTRLESEPNFEAGEDDVEAPTGAAENLDQEDGEEDGEDGQEDDADTDDAAAGEDGAQLAGQAQQLFAQGEQVYASNCAVCHGSEGQGNVGPALAGNGFLERTQSVINMILVGRPDHGMPAWGGQFDDEQVAAVGTYIRNAWGNGYGAIEPDQVGEARE